jgi:hypothetical protein
MGGSSNNVPLPAPIMVAAPTAEEIAAAAALEEANLARGRRATGAQRATANNVQSQSRSSGFSGSGIYIPGS